MLKKPIKLPQLLYNLYDTPIYSDVNITGLSLDSRTIQPGDLFFAIKGTAKDGRKYIKEAIKKGAAAVLEEIDNKAVAFHTEDNVPVLPVHHLNLKIGNIASYFFENPSHKLKVVGVTGTNGKTSCTWFLAQALSILEKKCGLIGTLGNGLYGKIKESSLTTPDAITLQALLADFYKQHLKYVSMEVSSHSIDQGRVNGIQFEAGIFTNLSRDHLDYHGTMEAYGATKARFIGGGSLKHRIINADDALGLQLLTSLNDKKSYAYTIDPSTIIPGHVKLIAATDVRSTSAGLTAKISSPWGEGKLTVPLLGTFNLSNLLAVFTALCLLKFPFEKVLAALSQVTSVPGRMQTLGGDLKHPLIIIDYAHSPDALEKVLKAIRMHCTGQLYCLFGCGGDRDRGKRPLMAKIAEQYADRVMVTDDNPRTEDSTQIIDEIMQGFEHPSRIIIQQDRSKAIREVIQYAQPGDCVLIAGKGAESYQLIGEQKIPFSDAEHAKQQLFGDKI